MGKIKKRGKKDHLVFMRERAVQMREKKKYKYKPKRLAVLCEKVLKKYKLLPATALIEPSESFLVGGNAIEMEVVADVSQHLQQTEQQSQLNEQPTQTRPYSNAERQKRYRQKRKADKMNACTTSSQSSGVEPQQEQPHDVQINKRQPQSSAERQRKYRKLLREQKRQQQQMGDTSSLRQLKNVDPAELERKRHLNKQRQKRFRAKQRFESSSTSSHQAQAERPLRKRKEPIPKEPKTKPDGRPGKKRGRPIIRKQDNKKADGTPGPKKHETELVNLDFEEESVIIKMEELDIPPDSDPFGEEKSEFLVDIKEELPEDNEENNLIEAGPSVTETNILMPTLIPTLKPGQASTSNPSAFPVISVILDDIQIFANSVAEQLRAMPVHRALLVQLDIQNMLDNERQIMKHES